VSGALDFSQRPLLVFWETTRACPLACRHCRADAIPRALPGELTSLQGRQLIRQVAAFGRPHPVLVLTGGDCLQRADIFDLATYASELGVPICMSPSVTPSLTTAVMRRMRGAGVKAVSISLDGARDSSHDAVRGIPGHFEHTLRALDDLLELGFRVRVNTTVMRVNVEELADLATLLHRIGVRIWEVFFLIQVGRGAHVQQLSAAENEEVCHFLFDAACSGLAVRTVEATFFRRVVAWRSGQTPVDADATPGRKGMLYVRLADRMHTLLGPPRGRPAAQSLATRDGRGIIFIAYNGDVYPAGFLPLPVGNVGCSSLDEVYRSSELLLRLRRGAFAGRCGRCTWRDICGGSRARAFAASGDPLGEDPGCVHVPTAAAYGPDQPRSVGRLAREPAPSAEGGGGGSRIRSRPAC
jgi:radical SAM protein